jgi:hypothetical protein
MRLIWENVAFESTLLWLRLLLPFTTVKNLYSCEVFAQGFANALQEPDGARLTEILPSLQTIFVEEFKPRGAFQENIGHFVAARQLSGHPITLSAWNKVDPYEWVEDSDIEST